MPEGSIAFNLFRI